MSSMEGDKRRHMHSITSYNDECPCTMTPTSLHTLGAVCTITATIKFVLIRCMIEAPVLYDFG